jgi:hypothetical protein
VRARLRFFKLELLKEIVSRDFGVFFISLDRNEAPYHVYSVFKFIFFTNHAVVKILQS